MNIESIRHIKQINTEKKIEKAIQDTKDQLKDLIVEPTSIIYSSYLSENLYNEHIVHEIVSTSEYEYPYEYQFVAIPKNENELYIIDLAYKQIQSDKYSELLEKGYMLIKGQQCREYLDDIGNVNIDKRKSY